MSLIIRPEFRKYIASLGFTPQQLEVAYKKALAKSTSDDCTVIEVITRDILEGKDEPLDKSCANCLNDTCGSDEEPCFSCIHNPQTHIEDNWVLYPSSEPIPDMCKDCLYESLGFAGCIARRKTKQCKFRQEKR